MELFESMVDSFFLLDYVICLIILKVFVGLYAGEECIIKLQEQTLLEFFVTKIPMPFLWVYLFFGKPIYTAFRNLIPASSSIVVGHYEELQDFLKFFFHLILNTN